MSKNNYMSEDELWKLISEVEENEMVEAPFYMKDRIMSKAREEKILVNEKDMKRSAQVKFLRFSLKVALATAAAIMVLILAPSELRVTSGDSGKGTVQTSHIGNKLTKSSYQLSKGLIRFSNCIIGKEEWSFEKEKKE